MQSGDILTAFILFKQLCKTLKQITLLLVTNKIALFILLLKLSKEL